MRNNIKLLILSLLTIVVTLNADSKSLVTKYGYEDSYQKALNKAKIENKPIMLVLSTKTCAWCRKLERQTLKKDFIKEIIKKDFIPLSIDRDHGIYPDDFKTDVVPTVFIINAHNEERVSSIYGYKNKKEFNRLLLEASKKYKEDNK